MRNILATGLLVASVVLPLAVAARSSDAAAPPPLSPIPSPAQLQWLNYEMTMFVHFGVNTFTGREHGRGTENPALFNPTQLDTRQWARVAKECGYKGIVLTAKHIDGFCLWPTATTEYSVRNSPWKNGQGDVVRELADACRAEGVKLGIYCAPLDRNYKGAKTDYAEFYRRQLTELLSNYGEIYEMWFDGYDAPSAEWGTIIELVRKLQPTAIIKQGPRVSPIREDIRWVGNEDARAPLANWYAVPSPLGPAAGERVCCPVQCNTMLNGFWFWKPRPPHPLTTLLNFYYTSVGRGSLLSMNVGPNPEGRFSDESVARLRELHAAVESIFSTDLAAQGKASAGHVRGNDAAFGPDQAIDGRSDTYWTTDDGVTESWLEVDLGGYKTFNVVRLEEAIALGQRVAEYTLEVWEKDAAAWKVVNRGITIGHRKLDRFPKVTASKVRLTITKALACPTIQALGVHLDEVSLPKDFGTK